jgi:C4-dicarboxylate transporter DctM subunit
MAGHSGSGTAAAAAPGAILGPAMPRAGYPVPFSAALVGAAATIGPIIPPSIVMVIYASITGVSVGRLFLGGIVPGLAMGLSLMVITATLARRRDFPRGGRVGFKGAVTATRRALLVIVTPLIVVAGIVGGVFTPTESAAIACLYALVLGVVVYRTVPLGALPEIFLRTAWTTGKVMFVFAAASIFSWILARGNVPAELGRLPILSDAENPALMLLALNLLLLGLGALMDAIAIIVIITPMFLPLALAAGIDPVHLGVIMAVNISIGLVTPPVGSILFVLCGLTGTTVPQLTREIWVFVIALLLPLLLITYNPALVLFLPNLLMGPV